jgi:hypothetical protein
MKSGVSAAPPGPVRLLRSRPVLLLAFAVMADPVSSVAYAIEAALRALHGDLVLLVATMSLVMGLIALVIVNYHQLVAHFPKGGGAAAAAGDAFGEGWAFLPIGALIVDFALTIAISAAAGGSALIAYLPALGHWRVELAVVLIVAVAGLTWFGHLGRAIFAMMALGFIAAALTVLACATGATAHPTGIITHTAGHASPVAVALAFPVAMALATVQGGRRTPRQRRSGRGWCCQWSMRHAEGTPRLARCGGPDHPHRRGVDTGDLTAGSHELIRAWQSGTVRRYVLQQTYGSFVAALAMAAANVDTLV